MLLLLFVYFSEAGFGWDELLYNSWWAFMWSGCNLWLIAPLFYFCGADPDTLDVHRPQGIPWHHLSQLEARLQCRTNHVHSAARTFDFSSEYKASVTSSAVCHNTGLSSLLCDRQVNWRSITLISRPSPWLLLDSAMILTTGGPTICTRQSKIFVSLCTVRNWKWRA